MFNGEKPREDAFKDLKVEQGPEQEAGAERPQNRDAFQDLKEEQNPTENPVQNPEQAADRAVATVENRDAADPVTSSGWVQKGKEFFRQPVNTGKIAKWSLFGLLVAIAWWNLKTINKGLGLTEKVVDNPKSPEKWFSGDKKAEKK
jgi:hypothetical protein